MTSVTRLHRKEYVTKWFSYIHMENPKYVYRHFNYSISTAGPIRKKFRAHLLSQVRKSLEELQEYRCAIMMRQKYNITSHCWPFDLLSMCAESFRKFTGNQSLSSLQSDKKITLSAWTTIWDVTKVHSVSDIRLLLVTKRTLQIVLDLVTFEVLMMVAKKTTTFCDVTPCSLLMCFRETMKSQYTFTRLFNHIPEDTLSSVLYVCMSQDWTVYAHTHWPYTL